MKKRTVWIAVMMGWVACTGLAQSEWETRVFAGLNLTDGNSDTVNANVGLAAERKGEGDHTKMGAEYSYGETDSDTNVDNFQALIEHRADIRNETYGYGSASLLTDNMANIDYRVIAGAGIGQYLVRNEQTTLGVELGASWIFEDVVESDDYAALRIAQNLDHDLSETSRVFESIEYLPEFEDFDNYLVNVDLGLEADINEMFAIRLVFQNRYDSTPAEGNEENDLSLIAGLSYAL